jgi:lysophospholipase L1-like esterase
MRVAISVAACLVVLGCSGPPTAPSDTARGNISRLARTRFMAFGDSITVGEIPDPLTPYPIILQTELRSRYVSQSSNIVVVNAGVGGERLTAAVLRFESAFDTHRPEVVLLMEGINDLLSLGPDVSTTLLQFMAQHAQSRNARVFLASTLPSRPGGRLSQPVPSLLLFNSRMEAMARQQGLVYVDLYNTLLPETDSIISDDGLHPTVRGYRRIADVFFDSIRAHLEER